MWDKRNVVYCDINLIEEKYIFFWSEKKTTERIINQAPKDKLTNRNIKFFV